jgi:hypothetical protein
MECHRRRICESGDLIVASKRRREEEKKKKINGGGRGELYIYEGKRKVR